MTAAKIPIMDDPLGKYWRQPKDIREAPVDGTHALLTEHQFNGLHDYSSSIPSGVYPGKCWRRQEEQGWLLCWYGDETADGMCSIHFRVIIQVIP